MAAQKPRRTDLEPRPDLEEDSRLWIAVLSMAWYRDRQLHGLLHGLRCGGSRLERRRGRSGNEFLKLNYDSLLETWDKETLIKDWLQPNRDAMKDVFERSLMMLQSVA